MHRRKSTCYEHRGDLGLKCYFIIAYTCIICSLAKIGYAQEL